jgi:hypothetical protein
MRVGTSATAKEVLGRLSAPRLGSFGEAVFKRTAQSLGIHVEGLHSERADFVVRGQKTDVKTIARFLIEGLQSVASWRGTRVAGVQYAVVEFHPDGVRLTLDGQVMANLDWIEIEEIWADWKLGVFGRMHRATASPARSLPSDVTAAVHRLFDEVGLLHPLIL